MSAPISISTETFKKAKLVEIDGTPFKVRKFGAGEQLTILQLQRKIKSMGSIADPTDDEENMMVDLTQNMLEVISQLFDDMKGGEETKKLLQRIDAEDLTLLLKKIFEDSNTDGPEKSPIS